jgi:excisionase family DNA binding protein
VEDVGPDALDLLRTRDVAGLLKISERQAWRLIHGGSIESLKVGHSVRVTRPALAAYIAQCQAAAAELSESERQAS